MTMLRRSLLALSLLLASAVAVSAASPTLGSISPPGIQRGVESELTFSGARLADFKDVIFYTPGFTMTKVVSAVDNQVKVLVNVAADCQLGEHIARVRTATGVSEMRKFHVGPFPAIAEVEPNSEFDKPQRIEMNVTVHGQITSEDNDYFVVTLKKGQRLSAEVEGMRLGIGLFDPYLAILDSKRFELAVSDDAPLLGQDACVSIVAPEDGDYIIQVRDTSYTGQGVYRLHVGSFPRPIAALPAGGRPGEEVEVTFLGDPTGPFKQKVKVPNLPGQTVGVEVRDGGGIAPSPFPFRVLAGGNVVESGTNENPQTATPCEAPGAVNGIVSKAGEVDHYKFTAKKGQVFDVNCYARRIGSALDPVMAVYVAGGGAIASNDDSGGPDSYFRFTVPQDGDYILTIADHLAKGGPFHFYRVEFAVPEISATQSIPKVAQYSQERQAFAVPRGNRFATVVNIRRNGWGGDAVLGAAALPPGVTLHADTLPANLDTFPVVFEAAPTAELTSKLTTLTATPTDPNLKDKVAQKFYQMAELVMGGPGQSLYVKGEVDQAAIVVTEEAPFQIRIVEPKAPLVQNGSMQLKIVAERKPDFKAPINIVALYNPPGLGSASSVTIPEGANEAYFPINATGNAPVRKWKYAVLANATVGNGPLWVSSQLADLEVAAPFVTFAMERSAVEQGKETDIFCKITQNTPFEGPAKVTLVGLPNKVTTQPAEITKDSKELTFKVATDKTSPAGTHRNVFCQVVVMVNGEPVLHNVGGTELRIDVPIVPKVAAAPMPMPTPAAQPKPPEMPPEKRLTRLEKLRLEQQEREKAAQGGGAATPKK